MTKILLDTNSTPPFIYTPTLKKVIIIREVAINHVQLRFE